MGRVGFMKDNASFADLTLDGNGGLLAMTPVGFSYVANGPGGRGFDFNDYNDFWGSMVDADGNPQPGRDDQFQILYTAHFVAQVTGDYEFGVIDLDGENQIWLDRDQDGVFEANGALGSELIQPNRGFGAVNLVAGFYKFAIAYREGTASERLEVGYSKPVAEGNFYQVRIKPSDPDQIQDWAVPNPTGLDTSVAGTYTINYTATDLYGQTATASRTIVVVDDISLPFISINGAYEIIHEAGDVFNDPKAVVKDASNNPISTDLAGVGTVDVNTLGEYTLTYNYTDGGTGKSAAEVTRKVIVVDTTPPVPTLKVHPDYGGTDTVTLTVGNPWVDPGIDIQDAIAGSWVVSSRDFIPNKLFQAGFLLPYNAANLEFENDGGVLSMTPVGTTFFTSGAKGRGWDYRADADFQAEPIGLTDHDNFADYITGYFHARSDGDYLFATDLPGPNALVTIWLDLDQDGQFSHNGNSGDELLTTGTQTKTVFLIKINTRYCF